MDFHGAGNGAHRARANPVLARSFECCFAQLGMRGQAEIIVGSKIDYFLAVESAQRCLLIVKHAKPEMRAFGLEIVELVGKV